MGLYFKFYPLIIGLQIFCLYHAYKNKADQKWFWFIIVFPLVGALLYLYHNFYSKDNIAQVSEAVKGTINTNYETKNLEKALEFSDTVKNRTNLADKYYELGRIEDAKELYESCLEIMDRNNPEIIQKLMAVQYAQKDYKKVIELSSVVLNKQEFIDSKEHIMLAWSYHHENKSELARIEFKKMDGLFCNYVNRLEYAKFMDASGEKEEAISKAEQLISEINQMDNREKKGKRAIFSAIKKFHAEL